MRNAFVTVLILLATSSLLFAADAGKTTPPAENSTLLTAAEVKQVDHFIASLVKAGFPDARNAEVYCGKTVVHATFDPAKDSMPLPSDASNTQETISSSSQVIYGYTFDGLQFKLADGSWIISLHYHFVPKATDTVDVSAATKIDLATLTTDAKAANPFDAVKSASASLALIAPEQRERSTQAMNRLIPVIMRLHINPDTLATAVVLLKQAGWNDADDLSIAIADIRAEIYWQMRAWADPEPAFDPTGTYPNAKAEQQTWEKAHPVYVSEPPATALRRAMFRTCRAQMMISEPENALLPIDVAAAAAKTSVDENDPQGNIARIDALAAGAKLPVTPAAGADLLTRLQSWEERPRQPKMVVASPQGGNPAMSTSFVTTAAAYVPANEDLDALVGLLADESPSRFFDFSGPRTAGDNAWRAVSVLLKADPRTLAGEPTDQPWNNAERKAAAKKVQAWWAAHRGEYVGK